MQTTRTPKSTPDFAPHREVTAPDSSPVTVTDKALGMNMAGAPRAVIQVVPETGDSPSIEVLFWSEEAGKFVRAHTALAFAGVGASVPYVVQIQADGQVLFVAVTAGIATGCKIFVAAAEQLPV